MKRYFSLENNCLGMASCFADDFGEVILDTYASLDQDWISQRVRKDSSTIFISMDIRIQEMYHFLSVLKLFNPQTNTLNDGLSEVLSPAPPESWETQ